MEKEIKNLNEIAELIEKNQKKLEEDRQLTAKELADLKKDTGDLKAKWAEEMESIKKRQNELDELVQKQRDRKSVTYGDEVREQFKEKTDELKQLAKSGTPGRSVAIELKANDPMTPANTYTGEVTAPYRFPEVFYPNNRINRIRQFMDTIQVAQTDLIRWVQEDSYDNQAAFVGRGVNKPASSGELIVVDRPIQTLAHLNRLDRFMLEDNTAVANWVLVQGREKLLDVEDNALLYGTGISPDIYGLATDATAFANPSTDTLTTEYDVFMAAMEQLALANYVGDTIIVSPSAYWRMRRRKAVDSGVYLFPYDANFGMNLDGIPIKQSTAVSTENQGDFFIMDTRKMAATMFQRMGLTVEFFYQDRDNVQKNLVTIRIEERIALAVTKTDAIIYGNFAEAFSPATSS